MKKAFMAFYVPVCCFEPKMALNLFVSFYLLCPAALTLKFPGTSWKNFSKHFQVINLPGANMGM